MADTRQELFENELTRHQQLERRMLLFAASAIRKLDSSTSLSPRIKDQLTRSSSSIGANYAEACNSISKLDFRNKIYIAKKEAAETRFWLDLCIELTGDNDWNKLRQEANELLMILQSIVNNLKKGPA